MHTLYVFSTTGNCLQVAKDIASEHSEISILSIPKEMKEDHWAIEGDAVGFVFPCYYGDTPHLVKEFIEKATTVHSTYTYAVVTGGGSAGHSLKTLKEVLLSRGVKLNYSKGLSLVSNYMNGWYYNMIQPSPTRLAVLIKDTKGKCLQIGRDINNQTQSIEPPHFISYIMPQIISPKRYTTDTRPWDSEFTVSSACNGCGICAKACPVNNITMASKTPEFHHNCQRCMACIQHCPKSAFLIQGKAMKKPKYIHPQVTTKDIIVFNR